jgi:hypothetical protein
VFQLLGEAGIGHPVISFVDANEKRIGKTDPFSCGFRQNALSEPIVYKMSTEGLDS